MPRTSRILQSPKTATTAPPPEVISVESDFVVILAALLCALICVLGLTAIIRCNWLRRGTVAGTSPVRALANKGLKKKVLNSLPKFTYVVDGGSLAGGKWVSTSECAICLSDFSAGDEVRVLPQCGHGFHVSCIDTWLRSHSSCPSCRAPFAVAKCQKCSLVPVVAGGGSIVSGETEYKPVGSDNATVNCNNSDCVGNHHHNVINNNNNNNSFLP